MAEGGITLLDGGMAWELARRGLDLPRPLGTAHALMRAPDVVRAVHYDFLRAGADIITTCSSALTRSAFADPSLAFRRRELMERAGRLAREAIEAFQGPGLVAGGLPPLPEDTGGQAGEYAEMARALAPFCDVMLCLDQPSGHSARQAALAAAETGRPVWVVFRLSGDHSGRLPAGEPLEEAAAHLAGLPVTAILAGGSTPEAATAALRRLARLRGSEPAPWLTGAHPHGLDPSIGPWDGADSAEDPPARRQDLDPAGFAVHGRDWLNAGARVLGGGAGIGPGHIAYLASLLLMSAPGGEEAPGSAPRPGFGH